MIYNDETGKPIVEVVDNYLDSGIADELEETFTGKNPEWRFQSEVCTDQPDNSYFFGFILWKQPEGVVSEWFNSVGCFLKPLNAKALIRVKANMYPGMPKEGFIEHALHQDFSYHHKSGVYCVNTNDGYTRVGDYKIESIKNRFIVFDGSIMHGSTNCTDEQIRVTLNFNWF